MGKIHEITSCRVSGSSELISILNLGQQTLTGVFPKSPGQEITRGPLELVFCPQSGLVQLKHSYDTSEMYGLNYGYRSGLNASMVRHLQEKVDFLEKRISLVAGDVVLDIGSNDATTLKSYQTTGLKKVGIDPTGIKFKEFYTSDIDLVPDFFSAEGFKKVDVKKAKIVTSLSMFYDLEDPVQFAREVFEILDDNGVWHFEQSYLPSMLRTNSYDTVCHEHLEYYSLGAVKYILDRADFKIVDVSLNSINGGSFAVTATKKNNQKLPENHALISWFLDYEHRLGLHTLKPYMEFAERVSRIRDDLQSLVHKLKSAGLKIYGYGASTKGNVTLQYCGFGPKDIEKIAEVNGEKFGCYTPGTLIPIISEEQARKEAPDVQLVLPWHFRDTILPREKSFLKNGGKMIFPFPEVEIV
jgi:hypothetical protein